MAYLLLALILIALAPFVYDGIILPSLRLDMRFQLFALRDELRALELSETEAAAASITQSAINNTIRLLPRIDAATLVKLEGIVASDEKLKADVERRISILEQSDSEALKEFGSRSRALFRRAFLWNCGGALAYMLPTRWAFHILRKSRCILAMPEKRVEQADPAGAALAS